MRFTELRRRLLADHLAIYLPWQPAPEHGWYVIVWPSDYHPQGWSIRVTHPHRVINRTVVSSFELLGFDVQWSEYDARMEAWPTTGRSSPGDSG